MKFLLVSIFSISLCTNSIGQELKKITTRTEEPPVEEEFYVLKNNPEVRHGKYNKTYRKSGSFNVEGQYSNGKRAGVWTAYNAEGNVVQQIDFTNDSILFLEKSKIPLKSWIIKGDSLLENTTNHQPVLLGGNALLIYYLVKYLRYPAEARRYGIEGTVIISATVTPEGKMIDEKIEESLGGGLGEEALRIAQLLPDEWVPLKVNGVAVATRVLLPIKFKLAR